MTPLEREFSRQCTRSFPPSLKRHNFHPITAPQMLRCPLGGGTCGHSLINIKNPKGSIYTHFSVHHRTGDHFSIKVEGSHNHFLYTEFPGPNPPSDAQHENAFAMTEQQESAGARRRRQRLYPRLAGTGAGPSTPAPATHLIGVEELLTGSLSAPNPGDRPDQQLNEMASIGRLTNITNPRKPQDEPTTTEPQDAPTEETTK